MNKNILILTGEASGDARASEMLFHLKEELPGISFWGFGGDLLKEQGVELIEHIKNLSIVGVWEAVVKLPVIFQQIRQLKKEVRRRRPFMAILIDYPGMNLKIARFLKKEKIPVVYYVLPQVWAWGGWRIRTIRKNVDLALALFPFEETLFRNSGVNCSFVGHPVAEKAPPDLAEKEPDRTFRLALLPGSRTNEVRAELPMMLSAARLMAQKLGEMDIHLAVSSNVPAEIYGTALSGNTETGVTGHRDDTFGALKGSDMALVASGTATLETALAGVPMVITYHTALLTGLLFLMFSRVKNIGMVNIVAGRRIVPELLQYQATAKKVAREAMAIVEDPSRKERMLRELAEVKEALSEKQPSKAAARKIAEFAAQTA